MKKTFKEKVKQKKKENSMIEEKNTQEKEKEEEKNEFEERKTKIKFGIVMCFMSYIVVILMAKARGGTGMFENLQGERYEMLRNNIDSLYWMVTVILVILSIICIVYAKYNWDCLRNMKKEETERKKQYGKNNSDL